jgi:hypothetical protein
MLDPVSSDTEYLHCLCCESGFDAAIAGVIPETIKATNATTALIFFSMCASPTLDACC